MNASGASVPRICPECGARNSGLSLYCAECGADLFRDADGSEPEDELRSPSAFGASQDPNATAEFAPVSASPQDTLVSSTRWASSLPWSPESPPIPAQPAEMPHVQPESRRGLILGWIASVLIALVIGFVIWSTLLSAATRDTITGWLG
jgi:hypothetical protein